jgi:acyl carrier protein
MDGNDRAAVALAPLKTDSMGDSQLIETMMETIRRQVRQPSLSFDPAFELKSLPDYDSVLAIQIVLGLEKAFDITLDEDDIEALVTLGDTFTVVRNRVMATA